MCNLERNATLNAEDIHFSKFHDSTGLTSYKSMEEYLRAVGKNFSPPQPLTKKNTKNKKSNIAFEWR